MRPFKCRIHVPHKKSPHGPEYQLDSGNTVHFHINNAFELPATKIIEIKLSYQTLEEKIKFKTNRDLNLKT